MSSFEKTSDGFYNVAASAEVEAETLKSLMIEQQPIVLTRVEDQVYAFTGICPHAFAPLGHGYMLGKEVQCPVHGWCFDVTVAPGEEDMSGLPLETYHVREENDRIYVKLSS